MPLNLLVIHWSLVHSKGASFVLELASFGLFSGQLKHGLRLDVLDIEAPFGQPAFQLLLAAIVVCEKLEGY